MKMKAVLTVLEKPEPYETGPIDQDGLWKKVIDDLFEDFLAFFAPDLANQVDFEQEVEHLDKELFQEVIDQKKGLRSADKLMKVQLSSGQEQWVLIHVEVQGQSDNTFSERMFQYFYRIFDRYDHKIVAIAVMTAPNVSAEPFRYNYYETTLHYTFATRHIFNDYQEQKLHYSANIFSKVVLAARGFHETKNDANARFLFKKNLMRELLHSHFPREKVRAVFYFMDYLLRLPDEWKKELAGTIRPILIEEGNDMKQVNEDASPTLKEIFKMEREEGEKKGEKKMQVAIARELLASAMPMEEVARVTKLPMEEVEKLVKEVN